MPLLFVLLEQAESGATAVPANRYGGEAGVADRTATAAPKPAAVAAAACTTAWAVRPDGASPSRRPILHHARHRGSWARETARWSCSETPSELGHGRP
mmetsp:Transcript_1775/g.4867  ORF Transcript_1775/g.4867 Transcript_1775/m.4867 type:complete len:98 (-) Transcript_1775:35-328(-)